MNSPLKFSGLDSIEQVQNFRHAELFVDRKDAIPLKEGEYYIPDLIGLSVLDEKEQTVGTLTDVLKTAANDVYEVTKPDGTTVLLPAIPECILEVKPVYSGSEAGGRCHACIHDARAVMGGALVLHRRKREFHAFSYSDAVSGDGSPGASHQHPGKSNGTGTDQR